MTDNYSHYELLSGLFLFPVQGFADYSESVQEFVQEHYPELAGQLEQFTEYTRDMKLLDQQELYTRSFEVQAITTLELGYVLFGEDYKRGALLVHMNRELRDNGIETNGELSDHLPFVLQLLARHPDEEFKQELVLKILAPALKNIIDEFSEKKMEYKNKFYKKQYKTIIDSSDKYKMIYLNALETVYKILKIDFDIKRDIISLGSNDFLKSVNTELTAENEKV
ncbi:MAG: hypothetical protein WC121_12600 [Candidatus Kapaibacterium sp.]